tara:strand:+ start:202 stop:384 length:183 start_codon:yes stop_codon:yes gene_type:complete
MSILEIIQQIQRRQQENEQAYYLRSEIGAKQLAECKAALAECEAAFADYAAYAARKEGSK